MVKKKKKRNTIDYTKWYWGGEAPLSVSCMAGRMESDHNDFWKKFDFLES